MELGKSRRRLGLCVPTACRLTPLGHSRQDGGRFHAALWRSVPDDRRSYSRLGGASSVSLDGLGAQKQRGSLPRLGERSSRYPPFPHRIFGLRVRSKATVSRTKRSGVRIARSSSSATAIE